MNIFAWVEKYPVFSFVCAIIVLTYIYGLCWTIVILITLYLIEQTLRDTDDEEEIYGKQLISNQSTNLNSFQKPVAKRPAIYRNMFTNSNNKKKNIEKRPSLQELVHLKRGGKDNVTPNSRQPLAAIIKNNMNIKFTNAELEKRKPLYTSLRTHSPRTASSPNTSRNIASPLNNRTQFNNSPSTMIKRNFNNSPSLNVSNLNGSLVLNRSGFNGSPSLNQSSLLTSVNVSANTSISSPLNDSLEVHGSYFINRSVLHSPAAEVPTSPSVPFLKSLNKETGTCFSSKSSAEAVVEALKQKSKRKRVPVDILDETNTKKKRTEDIDVTLMELLPNNAKRKNNSDDKEVSSIATQCAFDDDYNIKKKKKIRTEKVSKFGLSQNQIDELSNETAVGSLGKSDDKLTVTESEEEGSVKGILSENSKKTSQDSPFNKSVSFADTPDMKKQQNEPLSKTNTKLSALRNMESPYKRLFKDRPLKNITPESVKKMRKHPVYFTAKINIDEIQQHREEYGESGVSLKAFRLDKEEAAKRIDSLFDETDSDVDFKLKSVTVTSNTITVTSTAAISLPSLSTSTLLTSEGVKANLFGTNSSSSTVITNASATVTSTFSFGGLSSLTSSNAASSIPSLLPSSSTLTSLPSLLSSVASAATSVITTAAIDFGIVPSSSLSTSASGLSTTPSAVSAQSSAPTLPTLSSLSKVCFGGGAAVAAAAPTLSSAAPSLAFPSVSQTASLLPTLQTFGAPAAATSLSAAPATFNFGVKQQPALAPALSTSSTAASQPLAAGAFSFGASSIAAPAASSASGFSFAPAAAINPPSAAASSAAPLASVPSKNLFGGASLQGFGGPAAATSSQLQPSMFGAVKTTPAVAPASFQAPQFSVGVSSAPAPVTQASMFGGFSQPKTTSVAPPAAGLLPGNIFAPSQTNTGSGGFSFGATAVAAPVAPSTGFSFSAASVASTALPAPTGGFSFPSTTTTASTGFGGFGSTAAPTSGNIFNISTAPAASAPSSNIFGQASSAKTQPSGGIFGTPTPATTTTNIFGAASTASKNIFGAPPASSAPPPATQNIFGAAPTQNAFGSSTQTNGFGVASTQNIFGGSTAAPQPQASIFGGQSKPTGGFNFGAPAATSAPAAGGFSFGATTTASTGSVFGQSNSSVFGSTPATNNTNVFGAPAAAAPKPTENPFDFSSSLGGAPNINFGGASAAPAQKEMPKPSFNFGAAPATPTFGGTAASPAFGNIQQPAFGSPQPFGTPTINPAAAGGGGGFTIGSGTSNPPPTRQTQRARRRLRR